MKLKFSNIGKISEADIELNSITVIAGSNDTGKSTVGKLLYAVSMALHLITPHTLLLDKFKKISDDLTDFSRRMSDGNNINVTDRFKKLLHEHRVVFYDPRINRHARTEVQSSELDEFESKLDLVVAEIIEELEKTGTDDNITIDKQRLDVLRPKWFKSSSDVRHSEIQDMILTEFSDNLTSEFRKDLLSEIKLLKKNENEIRLDFLNNKLQDNSKTTLENAIFKSFFIDDPFVLNNNSILIDRSKPYLYYKHREHLASWLFVYGGIRNNYFDKAVQKETVEGIFSSVIDGKIERESEGFKYRSNQFSQPISMENVSTGIKSFAILKLLMETGGLSDCEFLILDEPEIHLHPAWQLKYAELLVLLTIHYPIRVVLTSHSPYFVQAIELYSKLHKIDKSVRFYKTDADGEMSKIINVTNCIEKLYEDMAIPFRDLEELRDEFDDE